jgi:hypothetical protein
VRACACGFAGFIQTCSDDLDCDQLSSCSECKNNVYASLCVLCNSHQINQQLLTTLVLLLMSSSAQLLGIALWNPLLFQQRLHQCQVLQVPMAWSMRTRRTYVLLLLRLVAIAVVAYRLYHRNAACNGECTKDSDCDRLSPCGTCVNHQCKATCGNPCTASEQCTAVCQQERLLLVVVRVTTNVPSICCLLLHSLALIVLMELANRRLPHHHHHHHHLLRARRQHRRQCRRQRRRQHHQRLHVTMTTWKSLCAFPRLLHASSARMVAAACRARALLVVEKTQSKKASMPRCVALWTYRARDQMRWAIE